MTQGIRKNMVYFGRSQEKQYSHCREGRGWPLMAAVVRAEKVLQQAAAAARTFTLRFRQVVQDKTCRLVLPVSSDPSPVGGFGCARLPMTADDDDAPKAPASAKSMAAYECW
jgi:hypothetical protein